MSKLLTVAFAPLASYAWLGRWPFNKKKNRTSRLTDYLPVFFVRFSTKRGWILFSFRSTVFPQLILQSFMLVPNFDFSSMDAAFDERTRILPFCILLNQTSAGSGPKVTGLKKIMQTTHFLEEYCISLILKWTLLFQNFNTFLLFTVFFFALLLRKSTFLSWNSL